jgi:competence protein ComEA
MNLFKQSLIAVSFLLFCGGAFAAPVNINRADAATIADSLTGVGPAKAAAIVSYREEHGPFKSVDALAEVKGIGSKTLDKNRSDILLSDAKAAQPK